MMRKKRLRSALGAATVEGSRSSGSGDGSPGSAAAKGAGGGARARRHCASKGKQQYLEVHIVEDHGDVLEHLYDAIGAKRVPFDGLRWMHLDSHPDLTLPPRLTPATVMDPPALYEAIEESPGGNAEFILPAVFAGHVDAVWWVRPPWADQLPDGDTTLHIGVETRTGHLRVTCPDVYYLDEGLYAPYDNMDAQQPCRPVRLKVCQAKELLYSSSSSSTDTAAVKPASFGGSWILDVCLDYYSTRNPFLDALDLALSGHNGTEIDAETARSVVRRYFEGPRCRQRGLGAGQEPGRVQEELAAFGRMTTLLLDRAAKAIPYRPTAASLLTEAESTALLALFPSTDTVASEEERVEAFIRLLLDGGPSVIAAVRAMGPHCACLPAHESGWAEVEGMIDETAALVGRLCRVFGTPPCMVLMARSARDGYTPQEQVDAIQERLLQALEGLPELMAGYALRVCKHYEDEEEVECENEGSSGQPPMM